MFIIYFFHINKIESLQKPIRKNLWFSNHRCLILILRNLLWSPYHSGLRVVVWRLLASSTRSTSQGSVRADNSVPYSLNDDRVRSNVGRYPFVPRGGVRRCRSNPVRSRSWCHRCDLAVAAMIPHSWRQLNCCYRYSVSVSFGASSLEGILRPFGDVATDVQQVDRLTWNLSSHHRWSKDNRSPWDNKKIWNFKHLW